MTIKQKATIFETRKKLRNKISRRSWWMLMVGINFVKTESNNLVPNLSSRTEMSSGITRVYTLQNVKGTFIITKNQGVKLAKGSEECSWHNRCALVLVNNGVSTGGLPNGSTSQLAASSTPTNQPATHLNVTIHSASKSQESAGWCVSATSCIH